MVTTRDIVVQLLVFTSIPALVLSFDIREEQHCYCISSSFGCTDGHELMGYCDKRCCVKKRTGDGNDCQCFHGSQCPPDFPVHAGACPNLIQCCPKRAQDNIKKKREL